MDKIDSDGGKWLVLVDYGSEGIGVVGQFDRIAEAVLALPGTMGSMAAIVMLPDIHLSISAQDRQKQE